MRNRRLDRSTLFGILLAVSGVMTALILDGGSIRQILQPTAALIVLAGTMGAVMIQFPSHVLIEAARALSRTLFHPGPQCLAARDLLLDYAARVWRHGMLRLDPNLDEIEDPFLRKAFTLAVDGSPSEAMRDMMELDMELADERERGVVNVLTAAGGFAPTLGIIGAVLGLIQVMQKMDNISEIGRGIAVAFVSTLYGLGLANLLLLPLAGKLEIQMREKQLVREMMVEAVASVIDGINPRALKEKLDCFVTEKPVKSHPVPEMEMVTR